MAHMHNHSIHSGRHTDGKGRVYDIWRCECGDEIFTYA